MAELLFALMITIARLQVIFCVWAIQVTFAFVAWAFGLVGRAIGADRTQVRRK